ncbi:hypothetical protein, partial [Plasmodium yoelii yoelii]
IFYLSYSFHLIPITLFCLQTWTSSIC